MTRFVTVEEVRGLHELVLAQSGGSDGVRDLSGLESAVAQPLMTFSGQDLYPSLANKAAALGYSLISNHPLIDGNKRIGHAAMETSLMLNGCEIDAPVDEQERVILDVASGAMAREAFTAWLETRVRDLPE